MKKDRLDKFVETFLIGLLILCAIGIGLCVGEILSRALVVLF